MKLLSIIVPVYNVEKYLSKCLDSLLAQDIPISDYEIIIINDGSTDKSLSIADTYSESYSNIRVISQLNKGLGGARNTGIKASDGKYLFFVDSDDLIKKNSLKHLLEFMEFKKLDALRFNYEAVNEEGEIIPKNKNATYNTIFSDKIVDGETFLSEYLGWACYVWAFLFDASFIKSNALFFEENLYLEDVEWLIRLMPQAKKVCSIDLEIYHYLLRIGSITQSVQIEKRKKLLHDELYVLNKLNKFSRETKNRKTRLWAKGMISISVVWMLDFISKDTLLNKKSIIKDLKKDRIIPLKAYHFTLKQWLNVLLINLSPKIYCFFKKK